MAGMTELRIVATAPAVMAPEHVREWAGVPVPPGHVVETGYVPIHDIVSIASSSHQLYPAEVERAYRRQLELGDHQTWPPPTGYWREDGRFVLTDGRNRFTAASMLGLEHLFVAWLRAPDLP